MSETAPVSYSRCGGLGGGWGGSAAPLPTGSTEHCRICQRSTATVLLPLSHGHVGRVCSKCRTCRRGKPYASKHDYQEALKAAERSEGGGNAQRS